MIERKCPFCGLILTNGGRHIYSCKENKENLTKDQIKLKFLKYNFGNNILENVCNDYKNLYSLPMLKEKYEGIDNKSVSFLLSLKNEKLRSISESANKISKEKSKQTNLKRWGVENPSQSQEIKDKKAATFMKHYGVDNIWKLSDYNKKCAELHPETHAIHMQKLHNGCKQFWINITDDELKEWTKKVSKGIERNGYYHSKLEDRFCSILNNLNISYIRQYHLKGSTHPYDFRLCDSKIIIEINGDYWHANPKKYNENDEIKFPRIGYKKVKDIWELDKKYINHANNCGFKVINIWEDTMNKMTNEELSNYFTNLLNQI